ncbi:uncharacterized protein LOC131161972 [Malania oleifera]|uniref:uncharacterized protein LOC131161972 n=1 Tax=Malania oleifera TaxID=397392 RepID=UPI0025AE3CB1|nr:uncharacterized protein LOC131161972 [Malania oleifera]
MGRFSARKALKNVTQKFRLKKEVKTAHDFVSFWVKIIPQQFCAEAERLSVEEAIRKSGGDVHVGNFLPNRTLIPDGVKDDHHGDDDDFPTPKDFRVNLDANHKTIADSHRAVESKIWRVIRFRKFNISFDLDLQKRSH